MRWVLAAVSLMLAGCAQPADEKVQDPLLGLCPQWAQGHGEQASGVSMSAANATALLELGPAAERYLDLPLDLYRVRFVRVELDGDLRMRAEAADGTRLSIRDYRAQDSQVVPVVSIGPGDIGKEFDLFLSPVLDDAPSAPAPASLNWTLEGSSAFVEFTVTYHYKACGI